MHIKLATPHAAQLSLFFITRKTEVLHLLMDLNLGCEEREKRKKAQHLAGFKPTTSLLRGMRPTAVLQPLPYIR